MHLTSVTIDPGRFPVEDRYPFNLPVIRETHTIVFRRPVTCFVGENGSGKSTFLKAVARASGIHLWGELDRTRYEHNPYEQALFGSLDIIWEDGPVPGSFFDSQTFRNYTRLVDEWASADPAMLSYYGGKSLVSQSHGQSLMAYFINRYTKRGIYFLDEPETALSPKTQLHLRELITEMAEKGHAQFIMATHSPILMSVPGADLYTFDTCPVSETTCMNTEHYRVWCDFIHEMTKQNASDSV